MSRLVVAKLKEADETIDRLNPAGVANELFLQSTIQRLKAQHSDVWSAPDFAWSSWATYLCDLRLDGAVVTVVLCVVGH